VVQVRWDYIDHEVYSTTLMAAYSLKAMAE
jgi:hypothetical protein